ncbi:MAG: sulfite exporter TauE/SafE family protein [Candidatus Bathyarchaeia archaeon]
MHLLDILLLPLFGFIVAVPSSMVGLGGGFIIVPILICIFHLPPQNAVAVSLVAISGTTISATIAYMRQGRVDYMLGLLYDILDIPGVVIGAYLTTFMPSDLLTGIVGFFIASLSIVLMLRRESTPLSTRREVANVGGKAWKRRKTDSSGRSFEYVVRRPDLALFSSLLGGIVTGLAGLGGGIIDTATMILLGVPPHIAVASSEFAMALTNGIGVIAHGLLNNVLVDYALLLTIGTIVGAQSGSLLAKRVEGGFLKKLICLIAFFVGLRLILLALTGL